MTRQFALDVWRYGPIGSIQLHQFTAGKRQVDIGMDWTGNPTIDLCLAYDFPRSLRGRPRLFPDCDVPVLVGTCIRELLTQLFQPREQSRSLLRESVGLEFERLCIRLGQTVCNGTDRALELHTTVEIVFQQTYTQGTQLGHNLAAYHPQRFRRVAGDEHALSFREQVTDQISDGVRFSGTGRSLYQDPTRMLEPARDPEL